MKKILFTFLLIGVLFGQATSLIDQTIGHPDSTYKQLLRFENNAASQATLKQIFDGTGDSTALFISHDSVKVQGILEVDTIIVAVELSDDYINVLSLEDSIEAIVDLQDLQGAVTDAQVPNDITITESDPIWISDSTDYRLKSTALAGDVTGTYGVTVVGNDSHSHGSGTITEADPLALLTAGTDNVKDTHVDWGTGASQVSAVDVPIADVGVIITATEVEGALQENRTAIDLNTAKNTNVSTSLTLAAPTTTTVPINSDGSSPDITLIEATTTTAGVLGSAKWNEIVANTAKVTNTDDQKIDVFSGAGNTISVSLEDDGEANKTLDISGFTAIAANTAKNTNVSTALSVGTTTTTTVAITSDGGADDVIIPAAINGTAGLLTDAKWDEIVANNAKVTNTDDQTIDVFSISGDNVQLSLEDDGEATKTVDVSTTTAVTANTAKVTYIQNVRDGGVSISTAPSDIDFLGADFVVVDTNKADSVEVSIADAGIDHDATTNYVAGEHIAWETASQGTIHATNYVDNNTQLDSSGVDGLNFVPDAEFTTHKTSSDHDGQYYTETEVDTWRNSTTQTEMGYVAGVTSDIQTQLGTKFDAHSDVDHDQTTNFAANEHYLQSAIVETGALNAGSITSGFGAIDIGASNFVTTGTVGGGAGTLTSLDNTEGNITNVGSVALDEITSDASTSIAITLGSDAGDDLLIDGTGLVYEGDNNRVGIGTASPGGTLDVAGEIRITSDGAFASGVAQIYTDATNGLVISGHAGTAYELLLTSGAGTGLIKNPIGTTYLNLGTRVGIGTDSPSSTLEVNGGVNIGGTGAIGDNDLSVAGNVTVVGTTINMVTSGTTLTVGVGVDNGTVSAGIFTDRTPFYDGDALSVIKLIKGKDGKIDHKSLPDFVRVAKSKTVKDSLGVEIIEEYDERNIGNMISVNVKALQQLIAINEDLVKRIEKLEE